MQIFAMNTVSAINAIARFANLTSYLKIGGGPEIDSELTLPHTHACGTLPAEDGPQQQAWDIIHLSDFTDYRSAYKAFERSISLSHGDTIWIIDNTVPRFPATLASIALNIEEALDSDVFKAIFTIYQQHHDFFYATYQGKSGYFTVAWRHETYNRKYRIFLPNDDIRGCTYLIMLSKYALLVPLTQDKLLPMLYTGFDIPLSNKKNPHPWKVLLHSPAYSLSEMQKLVEERVPNYIMFSFLYDCKVNEKKNSSRANLQSLFQRIQRISKEYASTKNRLLVAHKKLENKSQALEAAKNRNGILENTLQKHRQKLESKSQDLEAAQNHNDILESTLQEHKQKLESISQKFESSRQKAHSLKKRLSQKEELLKQAIARNHKLEQKKREAVKKLKNLTLLQFLRLRFKKIAHKSPGRRS